MPKVTVDGVAIEVPQGASVLQACELEYFIATRGVLQEAAE